LHAKLSLK